MATKSGYLITIKAFLPVDPNNTDKAIAALSLVGKAKAGTRKDVGDLIDKGEGLELDIFEVKSITRREAAPAPTPPADPDPDPKTPPADPEAKKPAAGSGKK